MSQYPVLVNLQNIPWSSGTRRYIKRYVIKRYLIIWLISEGPYKFLKPLNSIANASSTHPTETLVYFSLLRN